MDDKTKLNEVYMTHIDMQIKKLIEALNHKETMILVYSQIDQVRVNELKEECRMIDAKLLDLYTESNEVYLRGIA